MIKLGYLVVSILILVGLEAQNTTAKQADSEMSSFNMGNIVVHGKPPLTKPMVNNIIGLMEWALGFPLSPSQKTAATTEMIREWKTNDKASMLTTAVLGRIYEDLPNIAEPTRTGLQAYLRALILQSIYEDPGDVDGVSLLAAFHERNNCHGPCPGALRVAASQMLETQTGSFIQFAAKYRNQLEIKDEAVSDINQKASVNQPKLSKEGVKYKSWDEFFNQVKIPKEEVGSKSFSEMAVNESRTRNFINSHVLRIP